MNKITFVTGIYDMQRGGLDNEFKRSFHHYLEKLKELLLSFDQDEQLVVYCSKHNEEYISHFKSKNIYFVFRELEDFKTNFEFYNQVQEIRAQPKWKYQIDWLSRSPQATLEYYNPFVMSKMFMLNDIACINPFKSEYFIWIDAALTNTIHPGYFSTDKIQNKFITYFDPFLFLTFPYSTGPEIHGFERQALNHFCQTDNVNYVCRGGLFGGTKEAIHSLNGKYYQLLKETLNLGLMGTEESIFTILAYKYPTEMNTFELLDNGLISTFCESVKNDSFIKLKKITNFIPPKPDFNNPSPIIDIIPKDLLDIVFYILTFNSPEQLETTLKALETYQPEFLTKTKRRFCIDNSLDESAIIKNKKIADKYNLEIIKKDNIGICGGRQFVAEHFNNLSEKYYCFFEDDFIANSKTAGLDKFGFQSYYENILEKGLHIVEKESLDFLKFCFSEFYFNNDTQIAWFNCNEMVRKKFFPEQPVKLNDVIVPLTKFNQIKTLNGVPYALGEIYYCNWPLIMSRKGSREIFLEPVFRFPHEATIMSNGFEKMQLGKIKSGIILGTLFTHERFDFYQAERIECK